MITQGSAGAILLILALASGVTEHVPQQSTPPRFASGVEIVPVDVLVSKGGRPVLGLTAADFEVRDNGVLQEVTLGGFEQLPLNLVLVFDHSASTSGAPLEHLRNAGGAIVEQLKAGDRAAIVSFSQVVTLDCDLTDDRTRLRTVLDAAKPVAESALIDATYAGMMVAAAEDRRALVLVFTDGLDVSSWLTASRVLDAATRLDAVVYGVTSRGAHPPFLERLTRQTGGRLLAAEGKDLTRTFVEILAEFRQRYVLTYSPAGVSREGWHTLDVAVNKRNVIVRARPGYLAQR